MKDKNEIAKEQMGFVNEMKGAAEAFVASVDKGEIEAILLSGSVSRGDFFPRRDEKGEIVGMVDLIVMKKIGSKVRAEDIFGANQEPDIPFHCVKVGNVWFEILFTDFIDEKAFSGFEEARKFSFLESKILYDPNKKYENVLLKINQIKENECKRALEGKIGYINYLLSDYKKDRWQRRGAFLQMHENLDTAIRESVCCLFYKNNSYAPAEDRRLYYSLTLENLPCDYENTIVALKNQVSNDEGDYKSREKLFCTRLFDFICSRAECGN